MTYLLVLKFLKDNLTLILTVLLVLLLVIFSYVVNYKNNQIKKINKDYEVSMLIEKNKYQEQIVKLKDSLLKANTEVSVITNEYHEQLKKQNERTKESYIEVQKVIPSIVRESCDFGSNWLQLNQDYIRSTNNSFTNNPKGTN